MKREASGILDRPPSRTMTAEHAATSVFPPATLRKRLNARDRASQNQRVDVVGAFIGVHGFQIRGVAHHVIFDLDAVAAVHVAGDAGDVERLAAIVALDDGY